ncbi:MAG TPA: CDP-alcohol phosphatidyltransferase family protein [Eubacteriales bacterium]|nr:CDP-alcohol phosphatidyltransferase family protein [Eubacteriales bacterium]
MRQLPNILSGLRLVLVGVFVWLFRAGRYLPALSVFVFAFFTDVLDGQLARAHGWVTNLGKLLDPLADKMMTLAALVCIYLGKQDGAYLVIFLLMAVKEGLMIAGGLFMAKRSVVAMADWPGKIATGLFAVGVMLSLLSFLSLQVEPYNLYILGAATAVSYFALVYYAATQLKKAFPKQSGRGGDA